MIISRFFRIISVFLLFPCLLHGQTADSLKIKSFFLAPDSISPVISILEPDTAISDIHRYDGSSFVQTQGNTGRATQSLLFSFNPNPGFSYGMNAFNAFRFNLNSVPYLQSLVPYSRVSYVQGANKEQRFSILHHQKIYKNFNGTLDFRTMKSPGAFTRQKSNNTNFFINLNYHTNNNVYQAYFTYLNNVLKVEENGGIQTDSLVEQKTETNMRVIPVNLNASMNRIRENQFLLYQNISLYKPQDSSGKFTFLSVLPLNLQLYSQFGLEAFTYDDQDILSGFYPYLPADSNAILDSTHIKTIRNSIRINNNYGTGFPVLYSLGIEHQVTELKYAGYQSRTFNEIKPFISAVIKLPLKIRLQSDAIASINDTKNTTNGNYRLDLALSKTFGSKFEVKLNYLNSKSPPTAFDQYYQSALFKWENSFRSLLYTEYGFRIQSKILSAGIRNFTLTNPLYYLPGTGIPWQSAEPVSGIHAFGQLKLRFGPVTIDQQVHYQKLKNEDLVHVPGLMSSHQVSMEIFMFSKALVFHPGVELNYIQSYYADLYMPATRVFYYQNDKKTSDQIYMDFFINLRISRALIFLKYEHFNSLFASEGYFTSPSYPALPAAFKFGVDWVLRK
jgi:hypothetical protein